MKKLIVFALFALPFTVLQAQNFDISSNEIKRGIVETVHPDGSAILVDDNTGQRVRINGTSLEASNHVKINGTSLEASNHVKIHGTSLEASNIVKIHGTSLEASNYSLIGTTVGYIEIDSEFFIFNQ